MMEEGRTCGDCRAMGQQSCRLWQQHRSPDPVSPFAVARDIPPGFRMQDRDRPFHPLLCEAYRVLHAQPVSYWRFGMLLALATVKFKTMPMRNPHTGQSNPRGFTIPLISNVIHLREDVAGRSDAAAVQLLLHELAHRCGAVLPEWKLWFPSWFKREEIYGRGVNSADNISMDMLERYCPRRDAT